MPTTRVSIAELLTRCLACLLVDGVFAITCEITQVAWLLAGVQRLVGIPVLASTVVIAVPIAGAIPVGPGGTRLEISHIMIRASDFLTMAGALVVMLTAVVKIAGLITAALALLAVIMATAVMNWTALQALAIAARAPMLAAWMGRTFALAPAILGGKVYMFAAWLPRQGCVVARAKRILDF